MSKTADAATTEPGLSGRPYPARTEALPRQLDAITAPWLTRTLQNRYPGLVVEAMEPLDTRAGHTTKMRLALQLNDAGRAAGMPDQVCLKSNWSSTFDTGDICELEAKFYHFLGSLTSVPVPRTFYTDWDADGSGQGLVVMEDLGAVAGTFGHSTRPLTIEQAAVGLTGLAALHACWWDSPKLDSFDWLKQSMRTVVDTAQYDHLLPFIRMNLEKPEYRAFLPQWLLDDVGRLGRAFARLVAYEQAQTGPLCVMHGDAHLGNSFERETGERIWFDWQLVRKGRPWRDVTYFLIGSLPTDERRRGERDLLNHYCEQLRANGVALDMDFDQVWDQYRRWPIYGMVSWLSNQDSWGQIGLPAVKRFYAAAADLDSLRLIEG